MNTQIIRFYDNEKIEYPLIEIEQGYLNLFKNRLKAYQKNKEYNFDDFILLINKEKWFIRTIEADNNIFF